MAAAMATPSTRPRPISSPVLAGQHLGVVLQREVDCRRCSSISAATASTLRPLTAAWMSRWRETLPLDDRRRSAIADVGDLAEPHVTAAGPVDQQVADVLDAASGVRVALDDDVEDLLLLEHAADLNALEQGRLGATHIAGRDAERLAFSRSTSISMCRLGRRRRPVASTTPSTSAISRLTRQPARAASGSCP